MIFSPHKPKFGEGDMPYHPDHGTVTICESVTGMNTLYYVIELKDGIHELVDEDELFVDRDECVMTKLKKTHEATD